MKKIDPKNTLGYNVAFKLSFGTDFKFGKKFYTYIQTVYDPDPMYQTLVVVREIGTLNYSVLNATIDRDKEIEILNKL